MGKSHVMKTRTFIFCLADVRVAQFLKSCEIRIKNITIKPGIEVVHTFKSGTLQAELWGWGGKGGGCLQGQADLQSQFWASQGYK